MWPKRIVLIGPSGSGKSETARLLAEQTGYDVWDTDTLIVNRVGMPIAEFFARFGEPAFRALEREALQAACEHAGAIVATGGGVVLTPANWATMRPGSVIVGLAASPATLLQRIQAQAEQAGHAAIRPLLEGDGPARLARMLKERGPLYAQADVTIDTDGLAAQEVAARALELSQQRHRDRLVPRLCLDVSTGRSDIHVATGGRLRAPQLARERWPSARRVWLVSDASVGACWGREVATAFGAHDYTVSQLTVEPGEQSKRMAEVERLCNAMTDQGVTRRDIVVALGGGVVGDLAGFVASVCLRGLPLVQLPTSLLAMVDSSVGGKTGVNLPAGKNLAGAFYQPGLVVVDPDFLASLPGHEYRSGMAEVIKHGVIQPSTPLGGSTLSAMLAATPLDPIPTDMIEEALALNIAIKHSVVQADERESGLRMILNFGHTAGHAIEADGYRYRHGEAIAIGMLVAFNIGLRLGRVEAIQLAELRALLLRAGLPVTFDGEIGSVVARLSRDKKNVDGSLHWILPRGGGGVETVSDVQTAVVEQAIRDVHSSVVAAG